MSILRLIYSESVTPISHTGIEYVIASWQVFIMTTPLLSPPSLLPVSYTHLPVDEDGPANCFITPVTYGVYSFDATVIGNGVDGIVAVSYTHLDVYKRQDYVCRSKCGLHSWLIYCGRKLVPPFGCHLQDIG